MIRKELTEFCSVLGAENSDVLTLTEFLTEVGKIKSRKSKSTMLISGPPGTGKSYLAAQVAGRFGLSILHVDSATSKVKDKWITDVRKLALGRKSSDLSIIEGTSDNLFEVLHCEFDFVVIPVPSFVLWQAIHTAKVKDASSATSKELVDEWLEKAAYPTAVYYEHICRKIKLYAQHASPCRARFIYVGLEGPINANQIHGSHPSNPRSAYSEANFARFDESTGILFTDGIEYIVEDYIYSVLSKIKSVRITGGGGRPWGSFALGRIFAERKIPVEIFHSTSSGIFFQMWGAKSDGWYMFHSPYPKVRNFLTWWHFEWRQTMENLALSVSEPKVITNYIRMNDAFADVILTHRFLLEKSKVNLTDFYILFNDVNIKLYQNEELRTIITKRIDEFMFTHSNDSLLSL